jgi:hypothetical protein
VALLVALSVVRFRSPTYALEPFYTDHMQHEYSAWAFLHIGFRVFSTPMEDWHLHARHVHLLWQQLPTIYPPGLVLFFLPFGVASDGGLLPDARVHMLMVMVLGAAAVLASLQLLRTLRLLYEPTLAQVLAVLGTILFVTWGLDGFIDPLAAGLALLGIWWAERGLPGRGLVALVCALSLQFRLWYLWPIALAVAVRHRREIRRWQLLVCGVLALASLVAFALSVRFVSHLDTIPGIEPNRLVLTHGLTLENGIGFAAGCIVAGIVMYCEDRLEAAVAFVLALVLLFFVDQWQAWYPVLLVPVLATVRTRPAQVAVTLAVVEAVFYLGGFPNVLRMLHLYVDALR